MTNEKSIHNNSNNNYLCINSLFNFTKNLKHNKMEDLIKALQIFLKYGNPSLPSHCDHDYFYVDISPELVSKEDIEELEKLGFFIDEEYDGGGFGSFKYGSC